MKSPDPAGRPVKPCATCGRDTTNLGTMRCDRCWEVEHRLEDYLASGKVARMFALEMILKVQKAQMDEGDRRRG